MKNWNAKEVVAVIFALTVSIAILLPVIDRFWCALVTHEPFPDSDKFREYTSDLLIYILGVLSSWLGGKVMDRIKQEPPDKATSE